MTILLDRGQPMNTETSVFDPTSYENVRLPLDRAETLPPWCYTSEEFYRREVETIFMKEWNFLGRVERIPNPGDYFTVDYVGVPLVIVRDKEGRVRAFANTCQHRGSAIVDGEGKCKVFVCPYHGWTYGLDGKLRNVSGMEEAENFDKSEIGLKPVRLETWGGFIFVNLDEDAGDLSTFMGDLPDQMNSYGCENLVTTRRWQYDLACNWKIFFENAMEEYHIPMVHNKSISLLEVGHGLIETKGNWDAIREKHAGTRALLQEDQDKAFPHISTLDGPAAEGSHYIGIYPSTTLCATKDTLWWLELHPQGPHRTTLIVGTCFPKETVSRPDFEEKVKYYYKRWEQSVVEDNVISEIQHRGLNSPFAHSGRLSHLEPVVHILANWVLDRVLDNRKTA